MAAADNAQGAPGRKAGGVASGAPRAGDRAGTAAIQADLVRRVPPHSAEAEQAVLGGLLMRPQLMHSIADILVPADFYLPAHT
ncbi:MAG: replicative DNA helicase, partial [Desulfovibrio sp.]|nr:replicative DNA helicase [Desulfovibrio sp.]